MDLNKTIQKTFRGASEPFFRNVVIFVLVFLVYLVVVESIIQNTGVLLPLQILETKIVAALQGAFGTEVYTWGTVLHYPNIELTLYIGPICTAVREMMIFSLLVLFFPGATREAKKFGILIFVPLIFLENIARLAVLHPLAEAYGTGDMFRIHDLFWVHGQILFLVSLILIWFYFFVFKELEKPRLSTSKKAKKKRRN